MTERQPPSKLPGVSEDPVAARRAALAELVPEAFVDGVLDADALARAIGEERSLPGGYQLVWADKARAQAAVGQTTTAALLPDLARSRRFDTARHAVIEGENLEVLRVLQAAYSGQARLIYIDPPYNTGGQFIYPDDYGESLGAYLERTGQGEDDVVFERSWNLTFLNSSGTIY